MCHEKAASDNESKICIKNNTLIKQKVTHTSGHIICIKQFKMHKKNLTLCLLPL